MPEAELSKVRADLIAELKPWESIMAGTRSGQDYQAALKEAEYRRYMLDQIRERLLLSSTEKLRESSLSLNRDIQVLNQSTTALLKSSTRIEYLTNIVIIVGILTIAIIYSRSINQPSL